MVELLFCLSRGDQGHNIPKEERANVDEPARSREWGVRLTAASFGFWFFISHHNCQLPSTRDAAESMQSRRPGVRVVHRADMPSGSRFRSRRAEFCFTVDLREMKIPTSIKTVRYLYATAQPD
jgi:hypothetical protein